MTISTTTRKAGPFIGDGVITLFPFSFKVFAASDLLVVQLVTLSGVETVKVLTADYTVVLNANQNVTPGGTLTMLVALPVGANLTFTSSVANLQSTDLTNTGGFYPKVINDALDRATIQIQQLAEKIGRALQLPISSIASALLPSPLASRLLAWNAAGTAIENVDASAFASLIQFGSSGAQVFTTTGSTTTFTLAKAPGSVNNAQVYFNGVYQEKSTYTIFGALLTFAEAPPAGNVEVVTIGVLPLGATTADLVSFSESLSYPALSIGARLKQLVTGTNVIVAGTNTPTSDTVSQSYQNSSRTGQSIYSAIIPAGYNFASTVRVTADQQPGSTVQHMAGIDIYTYSACPLGATPNERNMVGLFTDGIIAVDNGKTWSINTAISDNTVNGLATLAGRVMIGWEADFQVNGASTVQGCAMFIQGAGTPAAANGFQLSKGTGTAQWTNGYITDDGAVGLNALSIGSSLTTGANTPGQRCSFNYRDGSNLVRAMFLQSTSAAMNLTSSELPDGFYFQAGSGNINLGVAGSTPSSNINLLPSGTGQVKTTSSMFASQGFQLPAFTVAALPSPATRRGVQLLVTDAGTITYRALATGGGTNITCVTSDGNSWLYM